ncbi:hypothetical protein BH10BAC4_BH10BAC4_06340 [soil metagenome]
MYTLTDKCQFQAQAIRQGRHKLAMVDLEIIDWITKQTGVAALDFSCETRETSTGSTQQLVHVILQSVEDVKMMQTDRTNAKVITERFLKYFQSADSNKPITDPLKGNVFPFQTTPFPEIVVTYRPLKQIARDILEEMLKDERRAILKKFETVWVLSQSVVFYHTDEQINENLTSGTSAKINEELEQVDKKYEFNQSYPYRFDSKESFDRDYEGKWHSYWK